MWRPCEWRWWSRWHDLEILWDNVPRSVPDGIGSFSVLSELCYFFKVFKINTPGDGVRREIAFREQSVLCLSWFSF